MTSFNIRFVLSIALASALLASSIAGRAEQPLRPETVDPADVVADICPTEWEALAEAWPELVATFAPFRVDPAFGEEGAEAMQRNELLSAVMSANSGAFLAWMSTANPNASEDDWLAAEIEHDLQNELARGRANFHLLECLVPVALRDADALVSWLQAAAPPEYPQELASEGVEEWMNQLRDFSACQMPASRVLFNQEYGRDAIVSAFMDTIHPMLNVCQN
jgi:hypothetical protein